MYPSTRSLHMLIIHFIDYSKFLISLFQKTESVIFSYFLFNVTLVCTIYIILCLFLNTYIQFKKLTLLKFKNIWLYTNLNCYAFQNEKFFIHTYIMYGVDLLAKHYYVWIELKILFFFHLVSMKTKGMDFVYYIG